MDARRLLSSIEYTEGGSSILYHPEPVKPDSDLTDPLERYIWIKVIPRPKPRFTRQDKWILHKKGMLTPSERRRQEVVRNYNAYKDALKWLAPMLRNNFPPALSRLIFYMPVPKSSSKKKKIAMHLQPHQVTPDIDNMKKAVLDIFSASDSHVFYCGQLGKFWINDEVGRILIAVKLKN